ncbi:hypothetical protein I5I01_gp48 [Mycobacterium phage MooMoo]|uniref:Uncharacterized protein n=1 Tax=Mycobacterium phage MooMoo TaxID=2108127 RepID=A0A2P1JRB0_9CAUD|nr:hypothetical protein I5I01_gp48 [Mycobacterium phage MooMoo]AVO21653.1 hypothetical protein SEA_MOOMOO_48 [Mycobacterium phage MooMoo]
MSVENVTVRDRVVTALHRGLGEAVGEYFSGLVKESLAEYLADVVLGLDGIAVVELAKPDEDNEREWSGFGWLVWIDRGQVRLSSGWEYISEPRELAASLLAAERAAS